MNNHKSNILLTFMKQDEKGDFKKASVTLANVRLDLTAAEIMQVATAFASLIMHTLDDVELVQYSYVTG